MDNLQERINNALDIAADNAHYDGERAKNWTIDQMVRALMSPEEYAVWVADFQKVAFDDNGDGYYTEWETGT